MSEIFGGGAGGVGVSGTLAVIVGGGGGGGGGIDFFDCEKAFVENTNARARIAARRVNFPIIFFL